MATQIIGRIAVKVMPDTNDFRRTLKRDLTAIEKSVDALDIKLNLDATGVVAQAKATAAKVKKELGSVTLRVNENSLTSLEATLKQVQREIEKLDEISVDVKLDRPALEAAKKLLADKVAEATKIKVAIDDQAFAEMRERVNAELKDLKFHPSLDASSTTRMRRQMAGILEQIEKLQATIKPEMSDRDKHKVENDIADLRDKLDDLKDTAIEPSIQERARLKAQAQLALLARKRRAEIVASINKASVAKVGATLAALSGARVLNGYLQDLTRSLSNLDRNVPLIGTIAEAIAGLGAFALASASNLFALSASLAQIGGLAFALPGLFGGIAIGLGASFAVLKDFNKVIPEVGKKFSKLQDQMSSKFWAVAEKPIRNLVDHVFPELSAGLQKTAGNLGVFFGGLATALTTSFDGLLGNMFRDLNDSIGIAEGATSSLASTIATLGKVGAGYLPRLAKWFVDIAKQFDGWLTAVAADGRLEGWIESGLFALKELGRVAAGAGKILSGLAKAAQAAGGSSLSGLADALERIGAVVNGATFQTALVTTFEAAHTAMDNLTKNAGPGLEKLFLALSKTATTVLPLAGETIGKVIGGIAKALASPAVQQGIETLFGGISAGVDAILPYLPQLGDAFGAILEVAGKLAENLGPVLGPAFGALADVVTELAPVLTPIIDLLGEALADAIGIIAPLLPPIAEALANLVTPELLASFKQLVEEAMPKLGELLPSLAQAFISLVEAVAPLLPQLVGFATDILPGLIEGSTELALALTPIIEAFGLLLEAVSPILGPLGEIAGYLIGPLTEALNAPWLALSNLVTNIGPTIDILKQLFSDGFVTEIPGYVEAGFNAVKGWFEDIGTTISGKMDTVVADIKAGWATANTDTGSAVSRIAASVRVGFDSVQATVSAKVGQAKNNLVTGFNSMVTSASGAMAKLVAAVKTGVDSAISTVKSLGTRAAGALGNLGGVLVSAGRSLISGFVSGITSAIPSIRGVLGGITDKLPEWKGPAERDATILTPAGVKVINGFIVGIKKQIPVLRAALKGLTNAIPSMVKTNIGKVNTVIGSMSRVLTANQKAHLNTLVTNSQTALALVTKAQDALAKRMKAAQSNLDDLRKKSASYASSIYGNLVGAGDVTAGDKHSYDAIVAGLIKARNAAAEFQRVLADLQKAGLNKTALDQIAQAGPEAGIAAGKSILGAGKSGVKEINKLQAELATYAGKAAKAAADTQYANGIHIAEGLVKGLKAMEKPLELQMLRIADVLTAAIKKALKIKSPSRVFMAIGGFVGQGFANGISASVPRVSAAMEDMASQRPSGQSLKLASAVDSSLSGGAAGAQRVLHYHAAEGSSINAEEDLFAAAERSRMVNW
ncbi:hypothetical protein [Kribbella italica]|uniref:Phage-related protein n=1 Tax=Kribbella italica TaxID=1540520 RepID=A0A7W9J165_9ACTN|nr:hypothetical protein [Kribbella italica]MBB5833409.1 phage-related protein [Kribbella italica]